MQALHVVQQNGGWTIKYSIKDPPGMLIARRVEALQLAKRMAARHEGMQIVLYKHGCDPEIVKCCKITPLVRIRLARRHVPTNMAAPGEWHTGYGSGDAENRVTMSRR